MIDLRKRSVARTLAHDVLLETAHGDDAYVLGHSEDLHAYSMSSGVEHWAQSAARCQLLAATGGSVFCASKTKLSRYDRVTGKQQLVDSSPAARTPHIFSTVEQLFPTASDGMIVFRATGSFEAYEGRSGAPFGASVPFYAYPPRTSPNTGTMTPSDPQAIDHAPCGRQWVRDSDGIHLHVACIDASARVRWSKRLLVGEFDDFTDATFDRGFLAFSTKESGAVASGSQVLRLSDGMVVARVRPAVDAIVVRADGELEGLLVATPTVTLLDLSGAVAWTSGEPLKQQSRILGTLRVDETLVVLSYVRDNGARLSSVSVELRGFDRTHGTLLWKNAIPTIASATFFCKRLSHAFGQIVVNCLESEKYDIFGSAAPLASHLDLFDPKNGVRTFSDVRR